jgi:pimeloyl-ACP methyl ester carboxylesterase
VSERRTILMVPGYNEPPAHFEMLIDGRHGIPGLTSHGFICTTFPQCDDHLRDRVDRFAEHVEELRTRGFPEPFTLLGYSLGGLVVRGYLRAYEKESARIAESIMIASPNWGVVTSAATHLTRMLRVPDEAMDDMNLGSDYLRWLNKVNGHWEPAPNNRGRNWVLDGEPWVAPEGARILTIMGLIPRRGGDNDGLVYADSATLGGRIPARFFTDPHANHLNIIGHFDLVLLLSRGFLCNDKIWPQTLNAILEFTGAA